MQFSVLFRSLVYFKLIFFKGVFTMFLIYFEKHKILKKKFVATPNVFLRNLYALFVDHFVHV